MTGFIRGLFGSKAKQDQNGDSAQNSGEPTPKPGAFYLDSDQAKTFGDIDYMRTAKSVRRTFPKTKSNPNPAERTTQISAMESMRIEGENGAMLNRQSTGSSPDPQVDAKPKSPSPAKPDQNGSSANRRRVDTSMDMFRNMARDMKKR